MNCKAKGNLSNIYLVKELETKAQLTFVKHVTKFKLGLFTSWIQIQNSYTSQIQTAIRRNN